MGAPSIKTIKRAFPDLSEYQVREVRGLLTGDIDPEDFKSVQKWRDQCYNWPPKRAEMVMCALDEILGGFGVEAIRGDWVDRYHGDVAATFVNMGDTYDSTVIHVSDNDLFVVSSWGDWVEANEVKRGLC